VTQFTWSIERDTRCPFCDGDTFFVSAPNEWHLDASNDDALVYVSDLVSGHWCRACQRLTVLAFRPGAFKQAVPNDEQ
jgi:protein-disulfide isomerase